MPLLTGHVLIIGDDPFISTLLIKIINRAGCQTSAVNREDAFDMLCLQSFECIILDWVMDEDRDLSFYQQVRNLAPQNHIYLFTGMSSGKEVMLALNIDDEEKFFVMNFHSLIKDVTPTALPLLKNMESPMRIGDE